MFGKLAFLVLFAQASAWGCSGEGDPAAATCYEGTDGALGVKETVKLQVKEYSNGAGKLDLTGSGKLGFTCTDHSFTKSGQEVSVDLSDCLPKDVTVPDVKYCSDTDTLSVSVKDKNVPLPIKATLKKVSCTALFAAASCSGEGDPAAATCYEGTKGVLGLKETVKLQVKEYSNGAGKMDLTGTGTMGFTCTNHSFTKSGQEVSVDLSDCLPTYITVEDVKYCSDTDTLSISLKDKNVPLPIEATLQKVSCDTPVVEVPAWGCSGEGDPAAATCYEGTDGALGVKETVKLQVKEYSNGAGKLDLTGSGKLGFTCTDHSFTKSGQEVSVDLSDCLPKDITVPDVKYCSDTDTLSVSVKDKNVPLPIKATLKKVSCAALFAAASCSGEGDPAAATCYEGTKGVLGLKETVKLQVKEYSNGAGKMDLTGTGTMGFTCTNHSFTKSGQEVSVDLSDCLPTYITVEDVKYCSDTDTLSISLKDKNVPLPIEATLQKVSCATPVVEVPAWGCSGEGDPAAATCYEGTDGALGVKETVKIQVKEFSKGAGKLDLTGSGKLGFTCTDHSFTKSGQEVSVDLSDCLPKDITVPDVKYCSDTDTLSVSVKDKNVPLPIKATLKKVSCAERMLVI